jgi:hypothetical protein
MLRSLVACVFVLLAASPLAAGLLGGSDEYLVIVNKTSSEIVVSYRVGSFTGPDFQQIVMMAKPMHSPGEKYTKIGKYWPLPEEQVLLSRGILTLSVSPNSGMMVGAEWRAGGVGEVNVVSPHLEIDGPNGKTVYDGMDAFAAFEPQSRGIRMLVVE